LTAFVSLLITPVLRDAFDNLLKAPALILTKWSALNDLNVVAHLTAIFFIVNFVLYATLNVFAIERVFDKAVNLDHNSLIHFVAHNNAYL
jgi:hypothetical protein